MNWQGIYGCPCFWLVLLSLKFCLSKEKFRTAWVVWTVLRRGEASSRMKIHDKYTLMSVSAWRTNAKYWLDLNNRFCVEPCVWDTSRSNSRKYVNSVFWSTFREKYGSGKLFYRCFAIRTGIIRWLFFFKQSIFYTWGSIQHRRHACCRLGAMSIQCKSVGTRKTHTEMISKPRFYIGVQCWKPVNATRTTQAEWL